MIDVSSLQALGIADKHLIIDLLDSAFKHVDRPSDCSSLINPLEEVMVFVEGFLTGELRPSMLRNCAEVTFFLMHSASSNL